MKTIRNSFTSIILVFVCFVSGVTYGQDSDKKGNIKSMVEKKSFVFLARSVSPTGGVTRYLTSTYTLQVDSTSVVSDLPYFGRVYQPEYGGDAGLKFTSTDFDYKTKPGKKGSVTIQIKTRDLKNDFQLSFNIFNDGNATLQVSGADRQPISYGGEVSASEK